MKNALILHGISNNHTGNWFPWISHELIKLEYKTWVPDLPQADTPNISKNNKYIFSHWEFDVNSIIIGHSSGAVAALGILNELPPNEVIDKAILISSFIKPAPGFAGHRELFLTPFDYKKIKTKAKQFILFHSDNDPYVPLEQAETLSQWVKGELIVVKGAGHFNLESNPPYKTFHQLLEKILQYPRYNA